MECVEFGIGYFVGFALPEVMNFRRHAVFVCRFWAGYIMTKPCLLAAQHVSATCGQIIWLLLPFLLLNLTLSICIYVYIREGY